MSIILHTPRLVVREFAPGEIYLLLGLYRDERVTQHVNKRTDAETKQKFAEALDDYEKGIGLARWGIFNPADGDFIGVCILKPADSDSSRIELGYVLAYKYWGMGLATELSLALIDYGFKEKGLKEICACTDAENVASQNVLLKAGLTRDGTVFWHGSELPFFRIENTFQML